MRWHDVSGKVTRTRKRRVSNDKKDVIFQILPIFKEYFWDLCYVYSETHSVPEEHHNITLHNNNITFIPFYQKRKREKKYLP